MNHAEITRVMTKDGTVPYGVGICPNPYAERQAEWIRRRKHAEVINRIDEKITSLFEIRFITPPETSECIASIITMTDSRKILELGTCTGFTSLHILKAIIGKTGAHLTTIDCRPAHDAAFFSQPDISPYWRHIVGWTPECLEQLRGEFFDLVFIDSDHSVEHCEKERLALVEITKPGSIWLFHDLPEWPRPDDRNNPPVVGWVNDLVKTGFLKGAIFPTAEQLDCVAMWGEGYPKECSPHLGIFIRS